MAPKKHWLAASLLLALVMILTACGTAVNATPTEPPTPTLDPDNPEYTITLTEFAFHPNDITLHVGQNVTFHVINHGATDHELMIGRNPLRDDAGVLGDGFEHDFFATANPQVEGDIEVMGMGGDTNMDMGDSSGEGDMAMETPTAEDDMAMGDSSGEEGGMDMSSSGEGGMEMENGFMAMFEPQQEATITFHVTEDMLGTWTMGCFEVSNDVAHYDQGMAGIVTVLPASGG